MKLNILPATRSKKRNRYEIVMGFMHGDMDDYTTERVQLENESDVVDVIEMLWKTGSLDTIEITDLKKKHKKPHEKKILKKFPVDLTCDEYMASLDKVRVVYYDNEGIHHKVEFNV